MKYLYLYNKKDYRTEISEYCPLLGYLWTLASSRPSISQLRTIFTDISAITLYYHFSLLCKQTDIFLGKVYIVRKVTSALTLLALTNN